MKSLQFVVLVAIFVIVIGAKTYVENITRKIEVQYDINTTVANCSESLVPLRDGRTTEYSFMFSHLENAEFETTVLTKEKDKIAPYCKPGANVKISYIIVTAWFHITQYRLAEINGIRT